MLLKHTQFVSFSSIYWLPTPSSQNHNIKQEFSSHAFTEKRYLTNCPKILTNAQKFSIDGIIHVC